MTASQLLYVKLASNVGEFRGQMAAASASVAQFGTTVDSKMGKIAAYGAANEKQLASLGSAAGKWAIASVAALGLSAKAAVDWERDWTGVLKTVDGTDFQLDTLEGDLRDLTKLLPSTHSEIAQVAQSAGQLGVAVPDIAKFTETMVNLGTATNLSAEDAAIALSRFNYVMGLSNSEVDRLGSTIVALGNNFPTTEAEITEMSSRLAASGRIAGLSADEVMGFAAALTSVGVNAEAGGTAFSKVFQTMNDSVLDGGEKLDEFARVAGMSAAEFRAAFETDAAGAIDAFVQGTARIAAEGESVTGMFDTLGMSDQRLMRAVLSLGQAGGLTADALEEARRGLEENVALTDEASKFNETAASRMKRSWNGVKDNMIDFGEATLPMLAAFADVVDGITSAVGLVPGPIMAAAAAGLALSAALGATVWAASKAIRSVGQTRANIAFMRAEAEKATIALRNMDRAMLFKGARRGAALLAGLTLASTELGDSFGAAHTAQYALMGAMIGPWGAAIGTGIGLFKDLRAESAAAAAQIDKISKSTISLDLEKSSADLADLDTQIAAMKKGAGGMFDDTIEDLEGVSDAAHGFQESLQELESATTGNPIGDVFDVQQMQEFADKAGPILEEVGLNLADVLAEGPDGDNWGKAARSLAVWKAETDGVAGRTDAVGEALAGMDDELMSTTDSADALSDALDALFNPAMDYDQAVIAWHESLRDLKAELSDGARTFDLSTEAGAANAEAVMDGVDALKERVVQAAKAGEGDAELTRILTEGRAALVQQGIDADFTAEQMNGLLNKYELTPEMVDTIVKQVGAEKAEEDVESVGSAMNKLDRQHANPTVTVGGLTGALNGIARLGNDIDALARKHRMASLVSTPAGQADGGFWPAGVPAAANGLYNDAHIQRAGMPRLIRYAEQETQGESFIPHAMSKRNRSTKILGQTAAKFGYDLAPRGMESASGIGPIVIQQGGRGPLVGSLTIPAMNRGEARDTLDEVDRYLRKIERGGRR